MTDATIGIRVDGTQAEQGARTVRRSLDDVRQGAANATGATRTLETQFNGLGSAARTLTRLLGAAGLALSFRALVNATVDEERQLRLLNQALVTTGRTAQTTTREMLAFSNAMQRATTFSNEAVLEVQRLLTNFRNIRTEAIQPATRAILDFAAATGREATQVVRTLGVALNDPINGMARLTQMGIALDSQQRDMIRSLAETGRMAEAQTALIEALEGAYGGAAEAARDTLGGALSALRNEFDDLLKTLGQQGLPGFRSLIETLTGVARALNGSLDPLEENAALYNALASAAQGLAAVLGVLTIRVTQLTLAKMRLNAAFLASPLFLISATLAGAVAGYTYLRRSILETRDATDDHNQALKTIERALEETTKLTKDQAEEKLKLAIATREAIAASIAERREMLEAAQARAEMARERRVVTPGSIADQVTQGAFETGLQELTAELERAENAVTALQNTLKGYTDETKEAADATKELKQAAEDEIRIRKERRAAFAGTIQNLQAEIRMLEQLRAGYVDAGGSLAEMEFQRTLLTEAQRLGIEQDSIEFRLLEEHLQRRNRLVEAIDRETSAREKLQRQRQEDMAAAAREARQAEAEMERMAREQERLMQQPFENAIRGIQRSFTDFFEQTLRDGISSFGDLARSIRDIFFRMIAEIAAMNLTRAMMGSGAFGAFAMPGGAAGLGGIAGGGGGMFPTGGLGSLFNLSSIGGAFQPFTTPGLQSFLAGTLGFSPSTAFTIGTGLTGMGFGGLGGLAANLLGLGGGGIASTGLGAAGGFLGGILGGPIGGAAGGFLGTVLGGLFGGGSSVGPIGHTEIGLSGGRLTVGGSFVDNAADPRVTASAAESAVMAINAIAEQFGLMIGTAGFGGIRQGGTLAAHGGSPGAWSAADFVMDFLRRPDAFIGAPGYMSAALSAVESLEDLETVLSDLALVADFMADGFGGPRMTQVEQQVAAFRSRIEELGAAMERVGLSASTVMAQAAAEMDRENERLLMAIEDPLKHALELHRRDAEARLDLARELGADMTLVERLNAHERQAIIDRFAESALSAEKRRFATLEEWLNQQAVTSPVQTASQRLAEAQSQFGAMIGAAQAGETIDDRALTALANAIISLGVQLYGGTAEAAALEEFVRSQIQGLIPGFATGGVHAGGLRIVGERGPELEWTAPSRIASADQTAAMMGVSREDFRELIMLVATLVAETRANRGESSRAAEGLDRLSRNMERQINTQATRRRAA